MRMSMRIRALSTALLTPLIMGQGCKSSPEKTVPREEKWGIYLLDLESGDVELVYSSEKKISGLGINNAGTRFVFSQRIDGEGDEDEEICSLGKDGKDFKRLTNNNFFDTYPSWSPDDSHIAFLSRRETDLDIYVMDSDGGNVRKLYDSGYNDGDVNWVGDKMVFTRNSQIWIMNDDGTEAHQVTDPPRAGEWGKINLPFGDYDPKLSPDALRIVFERLVDDSSPHGNYDIYVVNVDGSGENGLTDNGYTQGLPNWSRQGDRIVYLVTAIGEVGKYDIYLMNADGSNNRDITPDYFPSDFLCHSPIFSLDGSKIYFVGEWWE